MFHGGDVLIELAPSSSGSERLRTQFWHAVGTALAVIDAKWHAAGAAAMAFHPGSKFFDHRRAFASQASGSCALKCTTKSRTSTTAKSAAYLFFILSVSSPSRTKTWPSHSTNM